MAKKGKCVYCGEYSDLTKGHIPPRGLFSKEYHGELFVVPSCRTCNNDASKDDEYFRYILVVNREARESESLESARNALLCAVSRPESRGFTRSILEGLFDVELTTESGVYVEKVTAMSIDTERMARVVERIVRGLYWSETEQALHPKASVEVVPGWGIPGIPDKAISAFADAASALPQMRS